MYRQNYDWRQSVSRFQLAREKKDATPPLCVHTAHQIGALQFQLQKILFGTSQKCRDGQQTLISCTSFQILHLQLAVLFQTKSPMSTFSVSGPKILSHIMPRSADDDTVSSKVCFLPTQKLSWFWGDLQLPDPPENIESKYDQIKATLARVRGF